MRVYGEKEMLDRIEYLESIQYKSHYVVVECNYDTSKALIEDGYNPRQFDVNDELEDWEFDVYLFDYELNTMFDDLYNGGY